LTVTLAGADRSVIGVDPSRTMLDFARSREGAEAVTWVDGDSSVIAPTLAGRTADLVLMTGNTAQHILGADWPRTLRDIHDALRPGGLLVFESRNPDDRAWESWADSGRSSRDTSAGRLTEWLEVTSVTAGEVTFAAHNLFDDTGEDAVYPTTLAFRSAEELTRQLSEAGLTVRRIDGGWSGEPVSTASRVLVVFAER